MWSRMHLFSPGSWSSKLKNCTLSPSRLPYKEMTVSPKQYSSVFIRYRWKRVGGVHDSPLRKMMILKENKNAQVTLAKKVKGTTKDARYIGVIIAGIVVTGVTFCAILRGLKKNPLNSIYSDALQLCCSNANVIDFLGEPIRGYRGFGPLDIYHNFISPIKYEKDGKKNIVLRFYLIGSRKSGTVYLQMVEGEKSKYEYRLLSVLVDGYPQIVILVKKDTFLYKYILSYFKSWSIVNRNK